MAKLLVLYKTPKDAAAFDRDYAETHIPMAKKIPGLRKYEVSSGAVVTPAGPSNFHKVAILHFDDMAAMQKAFASEAGRAAGAHAQTLSEIDLLLFDSQEV